MPLLLQGVRLFDAQLQYENTNGGHAAIPPAES
jgi:hypothetical protein